MDIIEKEKNEDLYFNIASYMLGFNAHPELFDLVISVICNNSSITLSLAKVIYKYLVNYPSPSIINAIKNKKLSHDADVVLGSFLKFDTKSTEIWVRKDDKTYTLEGVNEASVSHSPKRR